MHDSNCKNSKCIFSEYPANWWTNYYFKDSNNRSLMSMFRGRDDLGVICVNDWYVMDMQIRNLDGMGGSGWTTGAEGACSFHTDRNLE